jgi:RHS repeat-associated protein
MGSRSNLLSNAPNPATQSAYNGCLQEAPSNLTGVVQPSNRLSGMGFTTDAAGNLIADGVHTFTFDAENHLLSTAQTGQTTVTYKYDGDGKRVQKSSGTLYWYGLSSAPLMETSLTGAWNFSYYYFNGRITNRRNWSHYTVLDTYVPDALGNTRLVSGLQPPSTGVWDFSDYYPYGGEWVHPYMCCVGNHYKFTGKERDPESNLDNFGARYLTSNLGRFMSPDPGNAGASLGTPQSWNSYSYVLNNPLRYTDPSGLDCIYLNEAGNGVDHILAGDCKSETNDGYYVDSKIGTVTSSDISFSKDNNSIVVSFSSDSDLPGQGHFQQFCVGTCPDSSVTVSTGLSDPILTTMSAFKNTLIPARISAQEAVENLGFDFWHMTAKQKAEVNECLATGGEFEKPEWGQAAAQVVDPNKPGSNKGLQYPGNNKPVIPNVTGSKRAPGVGGAAGAAGFLGGAQACIQNVANE